jgi:hypothetical protein
MINNHKRKEELMKNVNRRIQNENLQVATVWDKPSIGGYPTKDSLLITFVHSEKNTVDGREGYDLGIAIKQPNDEPIKRIGKAIAYRNLHKYNYRVPSLDKVSMLLYVPHFLACIGKKIDNNLKLRFTNMFNSQFTDRYFNEVYKVEE